MDLTVMQFIVLTFVAVAGLLVVTTREPARQIIVVGVYGMLLTILFFTMQAPDVALSAMVVSTVGLPVMLLVALAKIRDQERDREEGEGQ